MPDVELHFHRTWRAPLEEVWALISNTDAFNRVAGFGMRFESTPRGWRGSQRVGPLTVTWIEPPITYNAPTQFTSIRQYDSGLVAKAETHVALRETAEGVELDYRVSLQPRGMALLVGPLASMILRARIERGLAAVERGLAGGVNELDPPPALTDRARRSATEGLAHLDPACKQAILNRLAHAPMVAQQQMRPLQIAAAEGLDADTFTLACLAAVQAKVLELRWQVLCPRCRGAKAELEVLQLAERQVHCDTCDIRYNAALADNVEVVFRAHPRIRTDEVPIDCVMSPSRTPHVVAQLGVAKGGELRWESPLERGSYRMEHGVHTTLVVVADDHPDERLVVLELRQSGLHPSVVRVRPGKATFVVRSRLDARAHLSLSRRWRPRDALTASRLLSSKVLRNALPVAVLATDLDTRTYRGAALVVEGDAEQVRRLTHRMAELGDWLWLGPTTAGLALESPEQALSCCATLVAQHSAIGIGLAEGLIVQLSSADGVKLCGEAIEQATEAVRQVGVPQAAIAKGSVTAFTAIAQASSVHIKQREELPALVAFASLLDDAPLPSPSFVDTPADQRLPERVAGYTVIRELDRGGMGRVLEVFDDSTEQRLAVKQMLPEFSSDRGVQQFFREAYYAVQITHPNIVEFRDWGLEDGQPYLVMEVLIGRSLQKEIRRGGTLPEPRVREILDAVLHALGAIHDAGLVHRDIKPANIYLLSEKTKAPGGVKLLDFGLMRRAGRSRTETFAGTPDYVAPEQVLLGPIDARTDLFSVGMVGYRMLTGRLPYAGKTRGQRALERLNDHTDPLLNTVELGALAPLIVRALQPDPIHRYATAAAMREALQGL